MSKMSNFADLLNEKRKELAGLMREDYDHPFRRQIDARIKELKGEVEEMEFILYYEDEASNGRI